jgi:redox-sensing transcriptional repressor
MRNDGRIPRPTIKRLSLYVRELESMLSRGAQTVSSRQLGDVLGLTDAQVRKDLAHFGQFGHPGVGYHIGELTEQLRRILGTDQQWPAVVVGAGNIGRAVINYARLPEKGFSVMAVFDRDPEVIGTEIGGHTVRPMSELAEQVRANGARIGMLAAPAEAAQDVAEAMIAAGVRGILNFAPVRLTVPPQVAIHSVDLTVSLERLAFEITLGIDQANRRDDRIE